MVLVTERNFLNMTLTSHEQDLSIGLALSQPSHALDDIPSMKLRHTLLHKETSSELHLDPVYIAPSAASQIITTDIEQRLDQFKVRTLASLVLVEPFSLELVNQFLDQLLFDLISISRSLVMWALRSAVIEILKPTLGANALHRADLELKEYLDGIEDYNLSDLQDKTDIADTIDVKSFWKKTRIRCMIYSALGDLEEEESILNGTYSEADDISTIPPVTAIFLTSILEFVGEQILVAAGRTALHKFNIERSSLDDQNMNNTDVTECLVVETEDMKRITFDNHLDDLWRAWRSYKEPPEISGSHSYSFSMDSDRSCLPSSQIVRETQNTSSACTDPLPYLPTNLAHLELEVAKITLGPSCGDSETKYVLRTEIESKMNQRSGSRLSISSLPEKRSNYLYEDTCHLSGPSRKRATSMAEPRKPQNCKNIEQLMPTNCAESAEIPSVSPAQAFTTELRKDDQKMSQVKLCLPTSRQSSTTEELKKSLNNNCRDHCNVMIDENSATNDTLGVSSNTQNKVQNRSVFLEGDGNNQMILENFSKFTNDQSINMDTINKMGEIEHFQETLPNNENKRTCSKPNSPQNNSFCRFTPTESQPMNQYPVDPSDDDDACSSNSLLPESHPDKNSNKDIKLFSKSQIDVPDSAKKAMANETLNSKVSETKTSKNTLKNVKSVSLESPSCFAEALQGIDIFNSTMDKITDRGLNKEICNHNSTEVKGWYPDTYFNDLVMEKPFKREPVRNISPISFSNDSITNKGHVSPVSTVSSMENTPDQEQAPQISRKNLEFCDSEFEMYPETAKINYLPKCSTHIAKSASYDSILSTHSHRLKVISKSEEDHIGKFDQLIQSDQTLQYTLTPQNVRVMNVTDPHQVSLITNGISKSSITSNTISTTPKYVALQTSPSKISLQETKSVRRFITTPQTSYHSASKAHSCTSQPLGARIDFETSPDDFSNCIKSTGPGLSTTRKLNSLQEASSSIKKQSSNKNTSSTRNGSHKRFESAPARIKLQSRDAAPKRCDGITDLIDFVRSGPQIQNANIYTSCKPSSLKSTSHGSEVNEVKNPELSRADLRSRQNSLSVNSSVTSQSALLIHSSKSMKPTLLTKNRSNETKQVISDPNYLKYSDEEDEYPSSSKQVQNESLSDFLRNTSPTAYPQLESVSSKTAKINISAPGLMSLFGRGLSNTQLQSKSFTRAIIPHQSEVHSSNSSTPSSMTNSTIPTKRFAPREATYSNVRTNDLAEFLMYNEPPPPTQFNDHRIINPIISSQRKEIGSIHKIFNRRKTKVASRF